MSDNHKPYISTDKIIPELGFLPVFLGVILGIVFGASSLYLALKVGMTVSASIPVAVLSVTIFKMFSKTFGVRQATILENNIVQTTGSAGESIAFGVAVTMPALLILGYDMELLRVTTVAVLGGLLGILMMIPLRRSLIVKQHGILKYPEGTACADVLIVGEKGGTSAKTVFIGFGVGFLYKVLMVGTKLWKDIPEKILSFYKGASLSAEVSPELLGVGYIIGPRIASIMVGGGILSSLVLIPAIKLFGDSNTTPLFPGTILISQMSIHDIWKSYILYIGAGAVAAGGIISLIQALPTIWSGLKGGIKSIQVRDSKQNITIERIDRDLPPSFVLGGIILLVFLIWMAPFLNVNFLGAILIIMAGFLFVMVSSRLTGEIGSSSNPVSGMTIATLLLTCLVFVLLGWTGTEYRVAALSIAAVACVAISNGGTTSQDLKTGYLVGGTPSAQQIAILVGALTSALVIGFTILILNDAGTVYAKVSSTHTVDPSTLTQKSKVKGPDSKHDSNEYHVLFIHEQTADLLPGKYLVDDSGKIAYIVDPGINGTIKQRSDGSIVQKYDAPKARLMSLIIDGILTQKLPWGLVLIGVFISIVLELCGISSLPFAVGVYLPLSASAPIFIGGLIRYIVDLKRKDASESDSSPGTLLSSGLIAGGSIAGIIIALLALNEQWTSAIDLSSLVPSIANSDGFSIGMFILLCVFTFAVGKEFIFKEGQKGRR